MVRPPARTVVALVASTVATAAFLVAVVDTADTPVGFSVMGVAFLAQGVLVSMLVLLMAALPRRTLREAADDSLLDWWGRGIVHRRWREYPRALFLMMGAFGVAVFGIDIWIGVHQDLGAARGLQGAALGAGMLALIQMARPGAG
jgi:hypothetical protein